MSFCLYKFTQRQKHYRLSPSAVAHKYPCMWQCTDSKLLCFDSCRPTWIPLSPYCPQSHFTFLHCCLSLSRRAKERERNDARSLRCFYFHLFLSCTLSGWVNACVFLLFLKSQHSDALLVSLSITPSDWTMRKLFKHKCNVVPVVKRTKKECPWVWHKVCLNSIDFLNVIYNIV